MKFDLDIDRHNIHDATLLQDVAAVATRLKTDALTAAQYKQHGLYDATTIMGRFGGWRAALVKARLQEGHNNAGVDAEVALADLRAVAMKLGTPTVSNKAYCAHGRYSDGPLIRAFGSWNAALVAAGLKVSKRARISSDSRSTGKLKSHYPSLRLASMNPGSAVGERHLRRSWLKSAAMRNNRYLSSVETHRIRLLRPRSKFDIILERHREG